MAQLRINDNIIWAKHISGNLKTRILQMNAGETIELEIDGVVGKWEKMKDYKNKNTPTPGIKPLGAMAEIWNAHFFGRRKNEVVEAREVTTADSYLEGLTATLSEWDSEADEEAYRDLQSR